MRMSRGVRGVALAVVGTCLAAPAEAQRGEPEPFLPGIVTVEGENVYRGTFDRGGDRFWFFRKLGEGREQYRIWVTERGADGWRPPRRVDLGGDHSDLYPTVSPDGRALVFSSYRPIPGGGPPQANLWWAPLGSDGTPGAPRYLGELSDPAAYDAGPVFDPDGTLRWTSEVWGPEARRTHRRARWTGSGFGPAEADPTPEAWRARLPDHLIWRVVTAPDGRWAAVEASALGSDGRPGPSDLWLSRRVGDGWGDLIDPGALVNTPDAYENFAGFTPDSHGLLFVRDFATYLRLSLEGMAGG